MDINILRIAVTLVTFASFLSLVAWAWSRQRRSAFDEAAQLPFVEESPADPAGSAVRGEAQ
jgi:cytochrome c oxidase cbb3-type subunit 4